MSPLEEATDPNTPPSRLIALARMADRVVRLAVKANAAVPLLALEDPLFPMQLDLACASGCVRRRSQVAFLDHLMTSSCSGVGAP